MKKLLMTGAAFLLMAGMGTTVSASNQNLFLTRNVMHETLQGHHTGHLQQHHTGHLQQHTELPGCVFTDSASENCSLAGTGGIHHTEADDDCADWTDGHAAGAGKHHAGDGCDIIVGADGLESCHIADGHCMMWTDSDADDLCDVCGYPVCHDADGVGSALLQGNGSAPQQSGGSVQQGNGSVPQQSGSSAQQQSNGSAPQQSGGSAQQQSNGSAPQQSGGSVQQGNGSVPQQSGSSVQQGNGDMQQGVGSAPSQADAEAGKSAGANSGAAGDQGQNSGSYDTGRHDYDHNGGSTSTHHGSGYGGSTSTHHGSGHHGSGHH